MDVLVGLYSPLRAGKTSYHAGSYGIIEYPTPFSSYNTRIISTPTDPAKARKRVDFLAALDSRFYFYMYFYSISL